MIEQKGGDLMMCQTLRNYKGTVRALWWRNLPDWFGSINSEMVSSVTSDVIQAEGHIISLFPSHALRFVSVSDILQKWKACTLSKWFMEDREIQKCCSHWSRLQVGDNQMQYVILDQKKQEPLTGEWIKSEWYLWLDTRVGFLNRMVYYFPRTLPQQSPTNRVA